MSFWNRWEPQAQKDSTRKIMAGAQQELPSLAQAQRGDQLLLGFKMKPEFFSGRKPKLYPVVPLLGIHPEETRIERDTSTPMFIAVLFTIAITWKQPRCPSIDEWIRKFWSIYTMEYYSAIKRTKFESFLMKWMNLEPILYRVK